MAPHWATAHLFTGSLLPASRLSDSWTACLPASWFYLQSPAARRTVLARTQPRLLLLAATVAAAAAAAAVAVDYSDTGGPEYSRLQRPGGGLDHRHGLDLHAELHAAVVLCWLFQSLSLESAGSRRLEPHLPSGAVVEEETVCG